MPCFTFRLLTLMNDVDSSWEKLLNPLTLKQNLIASSVFLTAYELLKDCLIGHLRGFFTRVSIVNGRCYQDASSYNATVRIWAKYELEACARWFYQMGAIDYDDVGLIIKITGHRNLLAHELPAVISSPDKSVSFLYLRNIYALTTKIDEWWICEIETDGIKNKTGETFSMRSWLISALIQVAEGNDSAIAEVYAEWKKLTQQTKPSNS